MPNAQISAFEVLGPLTPRAIASGDKYLGSLFFKSAVTGQTNPITNFTRVPLSVR